MKLNKLSLWFRASVALFVLSVLALFAPNARAQVVMGNIAYPGMVIVNPDHTLGSAANNYAGYLTGTAYNLTTSFAAVTGGTTSPTITIAVAGTYLIEGNVMTMYNAATYAANQVESFEFYRTNNNPGAISTAVSTQELAILTTTTQSGGPVPVYGIIYTASAGDVITIYGNVNATPSAGSMQVTGAVIIATRLY